jgi:hypothetical protein
MHREWYESSFAGVRRMVLCMIIKLTEDIQKQPNEFQDNTDKNTGEDKKTTK